MTERSQLSRSASIRTKLMGSTAAASYDILGDNLRTLVCTGNMGNQEPTHESLYAWIPRDGRIDEVLGGEEGVDMEGEYFDVIVIGMQEATWSRHKKDNENSYFDSTIDRRCSDLEVRGDNYRMSEVENHVLETDKKSSVTMKNMLIDLLGGAKNYSNIVDYRRGQMRLYIFVKKFIIAAGLLGPVDLNAENTGIGRVLNNKGGIVATVTIAKTRLTFLTAHLQAHEGASNYERRCASVKEILGGARVKVGGQKHLKAFDASVSSHYMFVMGDLNFRTDFNNKKQPQAEEGFEIQVENQTPKEAAVLSHEMHVDKALKLVEDKNWEALMKVDELNRALQDGELLVGFDTPPCTFNPTFKVEREDGYVYKKQRTPSYTDRIIYKASKGFEGQIKVLKYEPCPDFITSDHKPMRGVFMLGTVTATSTCTKVPRKGLARKGSTMDFFRPNAEKISFRVILKNMKCSGLPSMDPNGLADPYIELRLDSKKLKKPSLKKGLCRILSSKPWPQSRIITRNLNPVWNKDDDVSIKVLVSKEEMLFGSMLLITIMDYDMASGDDLIGTVQVCLYNLFSSASTSNGKNIVNVDEYITKNGVKRGKLECEVHMQMTSTN